MLVALTALVLDHLVPPKRRGLAENGRSQRAEARQRGRVGLASNDPVFRCQRESPARDAREGGKRPWREDRNTSSRSLVGVGLRAGHRGHVLEAMPVPSPGRTSGTLGANSSLDPSFSRAQRFMSEATHSPGHHEGGESDAFSATERAESLFFRAHNMRPSPAGSRIDGVEAAIGAVGARTCSRLNTSGTVASLSQSCASLSAAETTRFSPASVALRSSS